MYSASPCIGYTMQFWIIFGVSLLYCLFILCVTYFFIYKNFKLNIQKIIGFGAGFLSALVLLEFLPHTFGYPLEHVDNVRLDNVEHLQNFKHSPSLMVRVLLLMCGFLINGFCERLILPKLKFFDQFLPQEKHDCRQHDSTHIHHHLLPSALSCSAMGCFILCAFFDGIRLNSGFLINSQTAVLISIGLLFHLLPESITIVGIGLSSGFSRKALTHIIALFCTSFMAGSLSFLILTKLQTLEVIILSLASGLFIYVCAIHLIPATIKTKHIKWFVIGFLSCGFLVASSHYLS